ncbi:hypothetical protein [Streptomyces broussonetiae]|uniref:HNH endonuclease n=1 Tax=Streptomyces broussonetiae TaxID=2686304 RepID=A0ABV5E963_9ACTN
MGSSEGHVCPVCGQPVETVVQRHKTLGAWVPKWVPGPCHNPGCAAAHTEEGVATEREVRPSPAPEMPDAPASEGSRQRSGTAGKTPGNP